MLVPSAPALPIASSTLTPTLAPSGFIPVIPIFSAPVPSGPRPIGSAPVTSKEDAPSITVTSGSPVISSTDQGLKPIPPAVTQPGDPNGHHEITEPNFTVTKSCPGCIPVIEITATGWVDNPAEEQQITTSAVKATVKAGPSNIIISQLPAGDNFIVGESTTVKVGQTITVDNTPVAIQTTAGRVEVIYGTVVVALGSGNAKPSEWLQTTRKATPLPPVLTVGSETVVANSRTEYVVWDQTLTPGGAPITLHGTTISLMPSATAVIINGVTSALAPNFGYAQTTAAPALTFQGQTYTINRAGYITLSPGVVLKPGGQPVTIDGTTLSLDYSGTAVVIQGSTSRLQPATTVVTLTKTSDLDGSHTVDGSFAQTTGKSGITAKPVSGAGALRTSLAFMDDWLSLVIVFICWGLGCLIILL